MPIKRRDPAKDYLFEAILSLRTVEDCYNFFDDLCTIKEVDDMSKRICVAKMLDENTVAALARYQNGSCGLLLRHISTSG